MIKQNVKPKRLSFQRSPWFHVLCCLFLFSCENDPDVVNRSNERKPNIEVAHKIESFLSQGGKQRAKLIAPYMLRYTFDTSYLEFPRSLHVNFFDSTGKVESQVDALYGKYLETQSKVYLRDSVVAFNVKGDTLRTPDLWWDQNTRKFFTDKVVRFKSSTKVIYGGKGFEADQDLSNYTIFQPTGIIIVPDSMAAQ
jgi:LPS export ABC transporter protein LptC